MANVCKTCNGTGEVNMHNPPQNFLSYCPTSCPDCQGVSPIPVVLVMAKTPIIKYCPVCFKMRDIEVEMEQQKDGAFYCSRCEHREENNHDSR